MKVLIGILLICLIASGATAFALTRPRIDILEGPAYAFPDTGAFLVQQEELELVTNPQILGSIDMTDTSTLPDGTVVHAVGAKWTVTCTYLQYQVTQITDANGYAAWPNLHWGVYEVRQDTVGLDQVINGNLWGFGFVPGYPKQLVVCSKKLDKYMILRDSACRDAGVDVGLTEDFAGNPIVGNPDIGAFEWQPGLP